MTTPLHGTSHGDPPHPQPGDRVRFTVEGIMRDDGYLNLRSEWALSAAVLHFGTVEVIAPPLPPIPEEVGVVVRDPNGDLWTCWPKGWRTVGTCHVTIDALLTSHGWNRADLTIVSLPVSS